MRPSVAQVGAATSRGVQAAHAAAGLPRPPSWAGYWTFVSATIIIMFILFTAKKGTLGKWIGFLSWTTPQTVGQATGDQSTTNPQTSGSGASTPQNVVGTVGNAVGSMVGTGPANTTTPQGVLTGTITNIWSQILGFGKAFQ